MYLLIHVDILEIEKLLEGERLEKDNKAQELTKTTSQLSDVKMWDIWERYSSYFYAYVL